MCIHSSSGPIQWPLNVVTGHFPGQHGLHEWMASSFIVSSVSLDHSWLLKNPNPNEGSLSTCIFVLDQNDSNDVHRWGLKADSCCRLVGLKRSRDFIYPPTYVCGLTTQLHSHLCGHKVPLTTSGVGLGRMWPHSFTTLEDRLLSWRSLTRDQFHYEPICTLLSVFMALLWQPHVWCG